MKRPTERDLKGMSTEACVNGDVSSLSMYLTTGRLIWGDHAALMAAKNGHLNCLQFAVSYMAPMHVDMAGLLAAQNGHMDVLQYLVATHKLGTTVPWHPSTLYWPALTGHVHVVNYLLDAMKRLTKVQFDDAIAAAEYHGHLECVDLLRCRLKL